MIAGAFDRFVARLRGTTPRERAGLAALGAIAAATGAVYALDWAGQSANAAEAATQAAADANAMQATLGDAAYRRQLVASAVDVETWSRQGDVFAREEILAELEALGGLAGLDDLRVSLIENPERDAADARVQAVDAAISATFDWSSFLSLLEAFEASDLSVAVRSIDVADEGGVQRLTLAVSAPLIVTEERSP